jgi:hypothetical protein
MGRRLSIYDRETGFLAPWYLLLRAREEIVRTARYGGPLSLVVIEASEERCAQLNSWLATNLRNTDLVCREARGSYYLLLTETGDAGASTVMKRLIAEVPVSRLSVAVFPDEEQRVRELLLPLERHDRMGPSKTA